MGKKDEEGSVEPKIIVNELLASAKDAIISAKTKIEIELALSKFYGETAIIEARTVLVKLALVPAKITRKLDKSQKTGQIIDCLQPNDWKGINTNFAAVDLERVCKVSSGIGDKMQFRMEIAELQNKFETLTTEVEEINKLTEVNTRASENIRNANNIKNNGGHLYSRVVSRNVRIAPGQGFQRRPFSPLLSQKMGLRRHNLLGNTPEEETPHNSTLINEGFIEVKRNKRPSKITHGNALSNHVKSVAWSRTGILFATRFDPETKEEDVAKILEQNELINHPLIKAEELTTKDNAYQSFKVIFDLKEQSLSQFLRDLHDPNKCVSGLLIISGEYPKDELLSNCLFAAVG